MRNTQAQILTGLALVAPMCAHAHGFGALYNLPVPLWLYGWGAAATLILSFLMAALLLRTPSTEPSAPRYLTLPSPPHAAALLSAVRLVTVLILVLCLATAFFGHRDPLRNFSMTFFWIVFLLLFTYLAALIGNLYGLLNPWRTLAGWIDRRIRGYAQGRYRYPEQLGHWPALALYMGFIWFELFGTGRPVPLGWFLGGYTLLNLFAVWLVGARDWFRYGEFFAVFFRLVALMAPLAVRDGRLILRWPCAGLLEQRPEHLSTVCFALAMLATTAFDGLKVTQWWVALFWGDPTGLLTQWAGIRPIQAIALVRPWFDAWETLWLLASPFLYLGAYLLTIRCAQRLTGCQRTTRELALDFGYTLLPIAVVYHATHYFTLLLNHGLKIISLASDPFGWNWNLFGTAFKFRAPILPDMAWVWHSQVALILFGHVISVWIAHRIALRVFGTRRAAMLSQLPMLALMIGFTIAGLWILAQPLTTMRVH